MLDGVDRNIQYAALTLAVLAAVVAAHNATHTNAKTSFGLCTRTTHCSGAAVAGVCLGIEERGISCVPAENASTVQRAEAECALDAQGICNANPELTGTAWADNPNATWNGRSCTDWQEDGVELLSCSQTTNDITQWS